jgi:hypothetical protein
VLTKRAAVDGDPESFPWNRRRCALSEQVSRRWDKPERSRSLAVCPVFANKLGYLVNQKAGENFEVRNIWLPKRNRTQNLLVNSQVFETLCLRGFSLILRPYP